MLLTLASAGGVENRLAGYPASVPELASSTLSKFIEPGLTLWWFTLGAAFQSFPSTFAGYFVAVVGNVAFWLLVALLVATLTAWARKALAHKFDKQNRDA